MAPENLIAFDGAKLAGERLFNVGASSSSILGNGARKLVDGTVMNNVRELVWRVVDKVNDRPVGNPKRRFDEYSSKFSLSTKPRYVNPVGKRQYSRR
jgi:hypothetical protein